ncbi:protein MIS12 homolog isoform X1 [Cucurbita moschata]|uniref:Protein MIS12 homolog isoform X1 n=1 Tax=Cucurbita moschata TaxID=3662 RepID=A0A6J1EZI4_CUCMO|nr:protein MIS12 homolog isoform X1 [Cucurbita moschata]
MEGSKSDVVFDSLNLDPQLFINEALNVVDDLVGDASDFYQSQASTALKSEGSDRSQDLIMGISRVRTLAQSGLDKRLAMWEKYCLNHCFSVPEDFSLPSNDESPADTSISYGCLYDVDLDTELDSLRNKLSEVRKENVELNQEFQALERKTASSNSQANYFNEALQLYEQSSVNEMFQEMMGTASDLRAEIGKLKRRKMEDSKLTNVDKVHTNGDISHHHKGFSNAKLDDIQEFLAYLNL